MRSPGGDKAILNATDNHKLKQSTARGLYGRKSYAPHVCLLRVKQPQGGHREPDAIDPELQSGANAPGTGQECAVGSGSPAFPILGGPLRPDMIFRKDRLALTLPLGRLGQLSGLSERHKARHFGGHRALAPLPPTKCSMALAGQFGGDVARYFCRQRCMLLSNRRSND